MTLTVKWRGKGEVWVKRGSEGRGDVKPQTLAAGGEGKAKGEDQRS